MEREEYVGIMKGLLSGDPRKVREANQALYRAVVLDAPPPNGDVDTTKRAADLVLAEVAG